MECSKANLKGCADNLSIYGSTALVDLDRFFSFFIYTQSVGIIGRVIIPSQNRYLHREQHKQTLNANTSRLQAGFVPTIPVLERAKTVHALDRAATLIGGCADNN
jgi:hypothetical protein